MMMARSGQNAICGFCRRRMRPIVVLFAFILPIATSAFALEVLGDRHSLVKLRTRTFDLGTDVRYMRKYEGFVPVTRVRWIHGLVRGDSFLRHTVIHIKTFADFPGKSVTWVWPPDEDREQFAHAEDLADAWGLQDYDVRWRHKVAPSTRGDIILIPKSPDAGYYVGCGYDRANRVPTFCAASALYPPDPDLRIHVRIYKITDTLNDFREIVERALNLIYCLDVTREVEAGAWQPQEIEGSQSLIEFERKCKNLSS